MPQSFAKESVILSKGFFKISEITYDLPLYDSKEIIP